MNSTLRKIVLFGCAAVSTSGLFFLPQFQALASSGLAGPVVPEMPFDDPAWKALIGLAVMINIVLYILVCRRRTN